MAAASPTAAAGSAERQTRGAPGFGATLASEWMKLRTWRSTRWSIAIGVGLGVATTALITTIMGATWDDWSPAQQADFDPVLYSLSGILVTLIAFAVMGALTATSEYGSGMIRLTFSVTPRRLRVVLAKALIVGLLTLAGGIVAALAMFLVGQTIFGTFGLETAGLDESAVARAVFGVALVTPVFPLLGLVLGFLVRSTAGAITGILVLLWAPEIFGPLLPVWWQEHVMSLLPGPASDSIPAIVDSRMHPEPALGAITTVVWIAGGLALASLVVLRRHA